MADRRVRGSGKFIEGDIAALSGEHWGQVSKTADIADIKTGRHRYYLQEVTPAEDVEVVTEAGREYLRTTANRLKPRTKVRWLAPAPSNRGDFQPLSTSSQPERPHHAKTQLAGPTIDSVPAPQDHR